LSAENFAKVRIIFELAKSLTDFNIRRSLFNISFFQPFRASVEPLLKSECKVTPFIITHQIFLPLFSNYFHLFFSILFYIKLLQP